MNTIRNLKNDASAAQQVGAPLDNDKTRLTSLAAVDDIQRASSQLNGLTHMLIAYGTDEFGRLGSDIRNGVLWLIADLASEIAGDAQKL